MMHLSNDVTANQVFDKVFDQVAAAHSNMKDQTKTIMVPLFILTLIVHAAYSTTPCQNGTEIVSKETKNPEDLIGNWDYVYHWDSINNFFREFADDKADHEMKCPRISIGAITPEYVKAKEAECRDSYAPFNWADAKLKLDAPVMNMKGGILFIGEKENWMMLECKKMIRVVLKKVSENYIVLINPEISHISEMIARRTPTMEELKCVAHNVDVGKGLSGFGLCV